MINQDVIGKQVEADQPRGWLRRALEVFHVERARPVTPPSPGVHLDAVTMDACRLLRANLSPGRVDKVPPPLLMLSVESDPACASLAAGLAIAFGEEERLTLLVDADMRQPTLHTLFGLDLSPGFANALETPARTIIPKQVGPYLWVCPAGESTRSPADLLRLPRVADVTGDVVRHFEAIIYHTSGQMPYADALLLAAHVRSAILVVRTSQDSADQIVWVKDMLNRAGVELLGFAVLDRQTSARAHRDGRTLSPNSAAVSDRTLSTNPIPPVPTHQV